MSGPRPNLTQAEVNHLRRLLGWVRCDIGPSPGEFVSRMKDVADTLGNPEIGDEAKQRLVDQHRRAEAVPKYVRAAVKALEKLLVKQEGVVVDVEPGKARHEHPALPSAPLAALPTGEAHGKEDLR